MAKKVVKVNISGYYLIEDDFPEDVLGTATVEEFIEDGIKRMSATYEPRDLFDLVDTMLEDMSTKPTIRLELKKD